MITPTMAERKKTFELPGAEEILCPGHLACPGCGLIPALRIALRVLGRRTMMAVPACCYAVVDGPFPTSATGVPLMHTAFEAAAASASGIRAGLDVMEVPDVTVVAWAGDGGTFDIGLQSLSGAAERDEDMLYFCYDNEAYMNTGIQRSSATPLGAWTTTTPSGALKKQRKKDLGAIMAAHGIPYFATATIAYPDDLARKLEIAKAMRGFRMIHCFSPCPTGWKADARHMIALSRLAVETRVFPLYEVFDGKRWAVTVSPPEKKPLEEYLRLQGRFSGFDASLEAAVRDIDESWEALRQKESRFTAADVERCDPGG